VSDLKLKSVVKTYDQLEVVHAVDIDVKSGEFIVLVGPSGCGKSTILRMIAGLEDVSSGEIFIADRNVTDVPAAQREIAMVFQSYALYPHMTVRENLSFGLKNMKVDKRTIGEQIDKAADILQLTEYLDRLPSKLSGGQRQRVAIGRAIVRNPKIFLFDEPLSNLDAELRIQMRKELIGLHESLRNTMVYVTHDQVEAMTMADRIVVLKDGNVAQVGPPLTLYNQPKNIFVAGFIGSPKINLIDATVAEVTSGAVSLALEDDKRLDIEAIFPGLKINDSVTVGMRPERVAVGNGNGKCHFDIDVESVESLGDSTFIHSKIGKTDFRVKLNGQHQFDKRSNIRVGISGQDILLFDRAGDAIEKSRAAV
jgi:ABC-type sugar transport system ATPase subunit